MPDDNRTERPRGTRPDKTIDLICLGRGIVDLYAEQIGGRLEDAISFAVYVGGSAGNICIGAARLGLRTAMILRVGNDHMGRLIRETMARNGVDVRSVITDDEAPTPFCVLGVRDKQTFPRDLFARDCAYLQLKETDLDPGLFASARALLVNGTFFATDSLAEASRKAIAMAEEAGLRIILDVDYRPALWGLIGHGEGEAAYVESASVTARLQQFLPAFDLIVGTEEEIRITGGSADTGKALRRLRELTGGTIVLKRGVRGCVAYEGAIPDDLEDGLVVPGFAVDVMNTSGAGDSYMAGLLSGWLTGMPLEETCRIANACGAMNVARHGCSDSAPTRPEVEAFLEAGGIHGAGHDPDLMRLHQVTTRWPALEPAAVLDLSDSGRIGDAARRHGRSGTEADAFLAAAASAAVAAGCVDGLVWPGDLEPAGLAPLTGRGLWLARDMAMLDPDRPSFGAGVAAVTALRTWPREHILRVRLPADWQSKLEPIADILAGLADACRETRHEIVVDVSGIADGLAAARAVLVRQIRPDWWIAGAADPAGFRQEVARHDPYCRGVLFAGAAAPVIVAADALLPLAEAWFDGRLAGEAALAGRIAATLGTGASRSSAA